MGYAFISYSSKNKSFAVATKELLEESGIQTWMAPNDIPPGYKYAEVINKAVRDCSCFILLLSNDSQKSVWVAKETERAINNHKVVIPVQIEEVKLNDEFEFYISTNQIIPVKKIDKTSEEVQKLLQTVNALTGIKQKPKQNDEEMQLVDDWLAFKNTTESNDNDPYNFETVNIINKTLKEIGINGYVCSFICGPTFTTFEVTISNAEDFNQFKRVIGELSLRLGGVSIRIDNIMANSYFLQIANIVKEPVYLTDWLWFEHDGLSDLNLPFPLGLNSNNEFVYGDLVDFPHVLIGGTTGSGKSIFLHSFIYTLLSLKSPEQVKLVLIDLKQVEFHSYKNIPYLFSHVISESKQAAAALDGLVNEMERRYELFMDYGARSITEFNKLSKNKNNKLPYIVAIIDEFADLVDGQENVKDSIIRLAQKARASGIHLVLSTQRPSANVFTPTIKANIPTHIAFMTASAADSMYLLNENGAELLSGYGDMLLDCPSISKEKKIRLQGCFISHEMVANKTDQIRKQNEAPKRKSESDEELYEKIKEDIMGREYASISYITRTFGLGFAKSSRIFKRLIQENIVEKKGDARGCRVINGKH